jgi:hypothetical protein
VSPRAGSCLGLALALAAIGCTGRNSLFDPGPSPGSVGGDADLGSGGRVGDGSAGGVGGGAAGGAAGGVGDGGPASALLAYWPIDEAPGSTTTADRSGRGHHGLLEGIPRGLGFQDSARGRVIAFPVGRNTEVGVQVPYHPVFDEMKAFTLSLWFNLPSLPPTQTMLTMISRQLGATDGDVFFLGYSNGELLAYVPSGLAKARVDVPAGRWRHVALTYDARTLRLFLDGQPVAATEYPDRLRPSPGVPIYIGTNKDTDQTQPFEGLLDEIAIFTQALSPAIVAQLAAGASPLAF